MKKFDKRNISRYIYNRNDYNFHIERNNLFLCYDRHSDIDEFFLDDWGNPFICSWENPIQAFQYKQEKDIIRISIINTDTYEMELL
jgi:hypothetical protein